MLLQSLNPWVAKLVKSFGCPRIAESLDDFRYDTGKCDGPISFDLAWLRLAVKFIKNHLAMTAT